MSAKEAAAWAATAVDKTGPTMVSVSSSSFREIAPKIAPIVLPIPPTINISEIPDRIHERELVNAREAIPTDNG
jgi:hypothetical protein